MKPSASKKLHLSRETLRALHALELDRINGAGISTNPMCPTALMGCTKIVSNDTICGTCVKSGPLHC